MSLEADCEPDAGGVGFAAYTSVLLTLHFLFDGQLVVDTNEYFLPLTVLDRENEPLSWSRAE